MNRVMLRVLLVGSVVALSGCASLIDGAQPKPTAPFAIVDTRGVERSLASYNGSVLIVDLMATWCVPCRAEMEHLKAVRAQYPESKVKILSVGTDPGESDAQLDGFAAQFGASWPFARDTDNVAQKLGLRILPKLVIIDPSGQTVFENQGETYPAAIARVVNRYGA